jgi:hypothetical protein
MTPEYATLNGERVQVLRRYMTREVCRYCANEPLSGEGECPACDDGYEPGRVQYAKVGLLVGPDAGTTREVRARALR